MLQPGSAKPGLARFLKVSLRSCVICLQSGAFVGKRRSVPRRNAVQLCEDPPGRSPESSNAKQAGFKVTREAALDQPIPCREFSKGAIWGLGVVMLLLNASMGSRNSFRPLFSRTRQLYGSLLSPPGFPFLKSRRINLDFIL